MEAPGALARSLLRLGCRPAVNDQRPDGDRKRKRARSKQECANGVIEAIDRVEDQREDGATENAPDDTSQKARSRVGLIVEAGARTELDADVPRDAYDELTHAMLVTRRAGRGHSCLHSCRRARSRWPVAEPHCANWMLLPGWPASTASEASRAQPVAAEGRLEVEEMVITDRVS